MKTKQVFLLKVSYGVGSLLCPTIDDLLDAIRAELDCEDHLENLAEDDEHLSVGIAQMTQEQIDNAPEFGGW